jgi:hypothetical protein
MHADKQLYVKVVRFNIKIVFLIKNVHYSLSYFDTKVIQNGFIILAMGQYTSLLQRPQ